MTLTYNLDEVEEIDLKSYKSNEAALNMGLERATEELLRQQQEARDFEFWSFHKHPESWRGWYFVGVRKGKYYLDGNDVVLKPNKEEKKASK